MRASQREPTLGTAARTALALLLAAGVAGTVAACDGAILDATDPDIVTPDQLEGPSAVPNRVAGILFDFRQTLDFHVLYTGMLTDEYIHVGTFPGRENVDQRVPQPGDLSPQQDWFTPLATTQKTTAELIVDFEASLEDPEFENVVGEMRDGIAFAHLLRGYDLLYWGETYCQSILDQQGEQAPVDPATRVEQAVGEFEAAVPAAQAAAGGARDLTAEPNNVAAAAHVGAARAHMFLGNYQAALDHASQVPGGHLFQIDYSANTNDENNTVYAITHGDVFARRWSVGLGNDAGSDNERFAYADEFVEQGLVVNRPELDPQGSGPINLQMRYTQKADPIVLTSSWEARVIEAEVLWRQGATGQAEDLLNDLLDGAAAANPMVAANGVSLEGEWRDVELNGETAHDLDEIGFVRAVGLWQTGQRQAFHRRVFRNDGVDFFPDRSAGDQGGVAMSFPLYNFELDANPNVSTGCPSGNVPGEG